MVKPTILTYVDAGTSDVTRVMRAIAREVRAAAYEIRAVMADDLRQDAALFDGAVLFVMPGGADLPYCDALNGAPNRRIRRFVQEGGVYLGICAGAYYACRELAFHAGNADAIGGPRELGFVDALAVGSLPQLTGGIAYDATARSAAAAEIRTTEHLSASPVSLYAHYHGGCRFDFGGRTSHAAQILAVYTGIEGDPPAIVSARIGDGRAILTGVHLEDSAQECKNALRGYNDTAAHVPMCEKLAETEKARSQTFRLLLAQAGLALR
jgi:glutamine amidotransferase-like uncharacterized protein